MTDAQQLSTHNAQAQLIPAGEDRFGVHRSLGVSTIAFKVAPQTGCDVLVLENTFHAKCPRLGVYRW